MTPERLAIIEARAKEATAGPWYLVPLPWRRTDCPSYVNARSQDPHGGEPVLDAIDIDEWDDNEDRENRIGQADANLDFAANARTDVGCGRWLRSPTDIDASSASFMSRTRAHRKAMSVCSSVTYAVNCSPPWRIYMRKSLALIRCGIRDD
jgi:hypothetical protein